MSEPSSVMTLVERDERDLLYWREHWIELTALYARQFVAISDENVLATDPDFEGLIAKLSAGGFRRRDVSVEYIRTNDDPIR